MAWNYAEYTPVLKNLREENNVALANMTELSEYVLSKKDWVDITANNVNHPNDFLIRIEAQLICSIFF